MWFVFLLLLAMTWQAQAQTGVLGRWQDPTHSIIEIAPCGPTVCVDILAVAADAPSRVDRNNPNPSLRSRALCGLGIGSGFHLTDPNHAEDGHLYDPKSGRTYSGSMTAEGNVLKLRGYIGLKLFGRTESWTRMPAGAAISPCS